MNLDRVRVELKVSPTVHFHVAEKLRKNFATELMTSCREKVHDPVWDIGQQIISAATDCVDNVHGLTVRQNWSYDLR